MLEKAVKITTPSNTHRQLLHSDRFFQFVLVVLLLAVVALLSAVTTMHFAIHGAEVAVPDLKGAHHCGSHTPGRRSRLEHQRG